MQRPPSGVHSPACAPGRVGVVRCLDVARAARACAKVWCMCVCVCVRVAAPRTAALAMPLGIAGVNYGGAAVGPRKRVTYTIATMTGDLPGAGTSAGGDVCAWEWTLSSAVLPAPRAVRRQPISLSLFLSLSLSLSFSLSLSLSFSLSRALSLCMYVRVYTCVCMCVCVCGVFV